MKKTYTGIATGLLIFLAAALTSRAEVFTNLHAFVNGSTSDGALPNAVTLNNGVLFGAAAQGGGFSAGMVFTLDTNGTAFTSIHDFGGGSADGSSPNELLVVGDTIYGTTYGGGTNGTGIIFRMGTNGANYTVLRSFTNSPDPQSSLAGLTLSGATLYGTSFAGGSNNLGTVFKIDTNGANFAVLHHFTNSPDGTGPRCRLVLNDATLYGTASGGGSNNYWGVIFKLNTNGSGYSVLYNNFSNAPLAALPYVGLTLAGNTLYSVAASGGTGNAGAVYSLDTNGGNFTIIHSFTNNEALSPQSTLAASNGTLYGATLSRGTGGSGTVFRLATNGANFLVLKNFTNGLTGANPKGPVILDGNTVFGVANAGGPTNGGTVFRLQLVPLINAPPQNFTTTNGNSASFSVSAASDSALAYQWYFNTNTLLAGQTGSSLNLASTTNTDAGAYTVVISDFIGSITSSPALLTVLSAPAITAQPQSLTVTNGNPANFSVTATNGTLTYQWYFNTNTLLLNQTNNTFSLASTATNDAGVYTVVVANNLGSLTSSPAILTVAMPPPLITAQPLSLSITNGDPAAFSVTAVGGTLKYQWYFNTNSLLAGQTNSTFTIAVATTNYAGTYTVVVTNNIGSVTSSPALLTISTNSKPFIITQPQSLIVTNGNNAVFSAVLSGKGPLGYQWYSNTVNTAIGAVLAGKTNLQMTLAGVNTNSNARYFTLIISNSLGKATSSPALLTVVAAPLIISNPQPATVTAGSNVNFSVTALGVGLGFQWYSNSVNTAIGTLLAGQTGTSYAFTAGTNHNGRYYSVVVTNSLGKATSSPALLTVSSLPYFTLQPVDAIFTNGSSITFTSAAAGSGPLVYQWLYQTNQPVAGATNTSLLITNGNFPGAYSLKVTNSFGAVTSSIANLTISPLPYITQSPTNLVITNGNVAAFISAAAGGGTLSYQWLFNTNTPIAGATATNLVITNANQPGAYSMKVTNSFGAATSSPAILTVVSKPIMLSSAFDAASGSYSFSFVNVAGSTNRLWATTNLADANAWRAIATNIMATNGSWQFTDSHTAQTNDIRLYRFSTP